MKAIWNGAGRRATDRNPTASRPGGPRLGRCALLALLLAAGCSRPGPDDAARQPAPAPTPASAATPAPPQRLLVAAFEGDTTIWRLADAAGAAPGRVVGTVDGKAELWAIDDEQGQFYLRAGDSVWRGRWRGGTEPLQRLSGLPAARGPLHAAWIDAPSGELRALEMRVPSAAEARRMKAEPPDARAYWAVLWGLQGTGWVQLMQRATSWGADGSVGPAVLDDQRRERGRSARSIADASSCATLCDEAATPPPGIDAPDAEEWRTLPGTAGRVQFGVAMGDRWHVVGPVVLQQAGSAPRVVVPSQGQALHLQLRNRRLLASGDESATAIWVVDLGTAQVQTLPATATLPVWVD